MEVAVAALLVAAEDDGGSLRFGPGEMSWRRFWVRARWWARALRSRRRREADQDWAGWIAS